jgi:ATP-dependent Clp protease protease subunit
VKNVSSKEKDLIKLFEDMLFLFFIFTAMFAFLSLQLFQYSIYFYSSLLAVFVVSCAVFIYIKNRWIKLVNNNKDYCISSALLSEIESIGKVSIKTMYISMLFLLIAIISNLWVIHALNYLAIGLFIEIVLAAKILHFTTYMLKKFYNYKRITHQINHTRGNMADHVDIDTSDLPMDEETKNTMLELRRLQLEINKIELLKKKNDHDLQSKRDIAVLEKDKLQSDEITHNKDLYLEKARLELENALNTAKQKKCHDELTCKHELDILELKLQKEKLDLQIALREKQDALGLQSEKPEYLREPFVDGYLVISDRRIDLNGVIWQGTARHIIEQIEFFNNQSGEYPIFIVIDTCYGGSVREGLQIVKAMRYSRSPVYVVVKGFSASMSAVITTLAAKSFALPDAVILHHQLLNIAFGNVAEHREQLKILEEWNKRTLQPVAEKMGISLDEFTEQMYKHNIAGDWEEFADNAVKLKWVDYVVTDIRETGYTKKHLSENHKMFDGCCNESVDDAGNRYVKLPRLSPMDMYYIYNRDKYYRF